MRTIYSFIALALLWGVPVSSAAQVAECRFRGAPDALADRPSPLDSVSIVLGGAEAKLCYGRPTTGDDQVVGGAHPRGTPWEMGANEPTTLHLPFPATVGTVALEPGSYSLYAIPDAQEWTIVVNGNADRWGVPISASVRASDLGSFPVTPSPVDTHIDTLTFDFEHHDDGSGALLFRWERTSFAIPVARR